jgi:cytochrome oxidase Cu insertion factor (SCO1/SenC/PrrC family)
MNYTILRYIIWGFAFIFAVGFGLKYKDMFSSTAKIHNVEGETVKAFDLGCPFTLKNQNGQTIKSQDSNGKIRVVYFGYTYCPDLCPLALTNITEALNDLKNDRDSVVTYFITIDPERDTIAKLKEYSENFHPNIQMLYGTEAQLKPIKKSYKVIAQRVDDKKFGDYLIDHSTFIYILNKNGKVVDILPHTTSGKKIKEAILTQLFYKNHESLSNERPMRINP